jgi:heme/copper-type cytochrome/quinol oxidase subunit 1
LNAYIAVIAPMLIFGAIAVLYWQLEKAVGRMTQAKINKITNFLTSIGLDIKEGSK